MITFKIKDRDALGRICKVKIDNKTIESPFFLPVVDPRKLEVIEEVKKFDAFITNAYLLYKQNFEGNIHDYFNYDKIIFTDSGAYQLLLYNINISQEEIVNYEDKIGSDVKVMFDEPSKNESEEECKKSVNLTYERAIELSKMKDLLNNWEGVIQGGSYLNLIKKSSLLMKELNFSLYAVGVPPKLWKNYKFEEIALQGITARLNLGTSKLLHAFGMGLPSLFPLLVYIGYDIFDSASYILYAKDLRYMTKFGVKKLEELEYFPCNCKYCRNADIREVKEQYTKSEKIEFLAKHNLQVIKEVIEEIKQAIHENRLFDLVRIYSYSHPRLREAFVKVIEKFSKDIEKYDPLKKRKAIFFFDELDNYKSEIIYAKRVAKEKFNNILPNYFKKVYPFGHIEGKDIFKFKESEESDEEVIYNLLKFQFNEEVANLIKGKEIVVSKSKYTKGFRKVFLNDKLIASFSFPRNWLSITLDFAKLIKDATKEFSVIIYDKFSEKAARGFDVFAYQIKEYCKFKARQDLIVVDEKNNLLGIGESLISSVELEDFKKYNEKAQVIKMKEHVKRKYE